MRSEPMLSTTRAGTPVFETPLERDELGPEAVLVVYDAETQMRGVVVIDCAVLGPCGGGTRMMPDVTVSEVAALARSMTYKFGIFGFPRGGSKAGICADPGSAPEVKKRVLRAFGARVAPLLRQYDVACGPDMGVGVTDVSEIYAGAGVENRRTGLFETLIDGDPAAYHLTGFGVVCAVAAACDATGQPFAGASVAIEGFGQVGVGVARYAVERGARVVAISTINGTLYDEKGLDVTALMALRRLVGDRLVDEYRGAARLPTGDLFSLPADILVPGARPEVITESNAPSIDAKLVASAGNIAVTRAADRILLDRGIVSVPDFVANAGALIASLVDFHGGTAEQAFRAIEKHISPTTNEIVADALRHGSSPYEVAVNRVRERIASKRGLPRRRFDETMAEIKQLLYVF